MLNQKFEVLSANAAGQRFFDLSKLELIGNDFFQLLEAQQSAEPSQIHQLGRLCCEYEAEFETHAAFTLERTGEGANVVFLQKHECIFQVEVSAISRSRAFAGLVCVLHEVATKESSISHGESLAIDAAAANADAVNARDQFVHEISQPLCSISNFVGGLLLELEKSQSPAHELRETLLLIQQQTLRAGEIIRDYRDGEPISPARDFATENADGKDSQRKTEKSDCRSAKD